MPARIEVRKRSDLVLVFLLYRRWLGGPSKEGLAFTKLVFAYFSFSVNDDPMPSEHACCLRLLLPCRTDHHPRPYDGPSTDDLVSVCVEPSSKAFAFSYVGCLERSSDVLDVSLDGSAEQ